MGEAMFLSENDAYVDWWLLQKFPGRTLEELDAIDWPRLQRAMEVDRVVESEQRRNAYYLKLFPKQEASADTPDPDDLRMWVYHDRLVGEESDYS